MRFLITGASGFLGGHLSAALCADGHYVAALLRDGSAAGELPSVVTRLIHDGSVERLYALMEEAKPDVVVHLASRYIAEHKPHEIDDLIESNVLFGTKLLDAMSRCCVGRLINFGTSFQHFSGDDYHPVSLYAATKQAFHDLAQYYVEAHGVAMLTLKLSDTYGPHDRRGKIIALLSRAANSGEELNLSLGEQVVNFVHSDDVVGAVRIATDRVLAMPAGTVESYAIRGAELLSLRAFVDLVAQIAGRPINVNWGAKPYRTREVMKPWLGPLLPDWQPQIPLASGLKDLLDV